MTSPADRCTWCGALLTSGEGLRLDGPDGAIAAFCRLEHVVPWVLRGARPAAEPGGAPAARPERCSRCGAGLAEDGLVLTRHHGEHRVRDGFCSTEHLRAWAAGGGRWGSGGRPAAAP